MNDGDLILRDLNIPDNELFKISSKIVSEGYNLLKFNPVGESLEEYFFGLIGVKK
jgi:hypothetical protein